MANLTPSLSESADGTMLSSDGLTTGGLLNQVSAIPTPTEALTLAAIIEQGASLPAHNYRYTYAWVGPGGLGKRGALRTAFSGIITDGSTVVQVTFPTPPDGVVDAILCRIDPSVGIPRWVSNVGGGALPWVLIDDNLDAAIDAFPVLDASSRAFPGADLGETHIHGALTLGGQDPAEGGTALWLPNGAIPSKPTILTSSRADTQAQIDEVVVLLSSFGLAEDQRSA